MNIEVAAKDLLRLREFIVLLHDQLARYPVVESPKPGYEAVRDGYIRDMRMLRKYHRRLTLALRKVYGHDCHPEILEGE